MKYAAAFVIFACFISYKMFMQQQIGPYSSICLLKTKLPDSGPARYTTSSFISPDLLLTATENFEKGESIEVGLPYGYLAGKWGIWFSKNEFEEIDYKKGSGNSSCVRIIRLKNKEKSSLLHQEYFSVMPFDDAGEKDSLHLSGWQDSAIAVKANDTYEDVLKRSSPVFTKSQLKNISARNLGQFRHFNGSPAWLKKGKLFFITGILIHEEGGRSVFFFDNDFCKWLKGVKQQKRPQ